MKRVSLYERMAAWRYIPIDNADCPIQYAAVDDKHNIFIGPQSSIMLYESSVWRTIAEYANVFKIDLEEVSFEVTSMCMDPSANKMYFVGVCYKSSVPQKNM